MAFEVNELKAQSSERAPGDGFLVLWVGDQDAIEQEVVAALRGDGVRVELSALDAVVDRANRRAPDLVVLAGAAADAPDATVADLARGRPSALVPVITLGSAERASPKARSRYGLVARLDRTEGPAPLAKHIGTLLRGLSKRPPRWRVRAGIEDLATLARRTAAAGRTGILAAREAGGLAIDGESGELAPEPGLFVASLTGVIEPDVALYERAPGTLRVVRDLPRGEETAPTLDGSRVLVVDDDAERGMDFAARLEKAGAQARACGLVSQAIHSARAIDPGLVVLAAPALVERAASPLWEDARLATASVLVLDGDALAAGAAALLGELARATAPERTLRRKLEDGQAVAERLESVGPTRWLKLLGGCEHDVSLRVFAAAGRGRVDLSGGKIQGASFRPADPRAALVEGRAAVEALIGLRFGRVLAGPPGELGKLEGMRRQRKQSIVGRIVPVPTPPSGVRRKKGLIAEEVVVQRAELSPSVKVMVPSPGADRSAPLGDLGEDDEIPTRSYSAEATAELHAQLRRAADDEEPPLESGETDLLRLDEPLASSTERTTIPAKKSQRNREAEASDRSDELAGAPTGERSGATAATRADADASRAEPPDAGGAITDDAAPPPGPEEAAASAAAGPAEATAGARGEPTGNGRHAADDVGATAASAPAAAAGPGGEAVGATDAVSRPPRENAGSGAWFAAAIVLALAVGGYAAWQLGADADPAPTTDDDPGEASNSTTAGPTTASPTTASPTAPNRGAVGGEETSASVGDAPNAPTDDPDEAAQSGEPGPDDEPPTANEDGTGEPEPAAASDDPGDSGDEAAPAVSAAAAPPGADPWAIIEQSSEAAQAADWPRSEALARQALEIAPRNSDAAYRLAVALFRQQRLEDAMTWTQRASEWDPEDPLPLSLEGDLLLRVGRFHQAARAYQRALEVEPRFGPAQRRLDMLRERGVVPTE